MPLLKHAKKKQRQDTKRTLANKRVKSLYKGLVKKAKETKTADAVRLAVQSVDKAAKSKIIHKNKASRIKAALSKLGVTGEVANKSVKSTAKKTTVKKAPAKKSPTKTTK